jgi:hypothetical protein
MTITQETPQNPSLKVENYDQFVNNFINEVSIDLVQASINEAHFLKYVSENGSFLFDNNALVNAIRRYETIWLPIQVNHKIKYSYKVLG